MARIDREIALLKIRNIADFNFYIIIRIEITYWHQPKKKKQKRKEKTLDGLIKEGGSSGSFRFGKTSLMYNLK